MRRSMTSPIRLYELEATTAPLMSSRTEAIELKLPATIVLRSVTAETTCAKPPPAPAPLLSLSAVLFVTVTLVRVTLPVPPPGVTNSAPPPLFSARLPRSCYW